MKHFIGLFFLFTAAAIHAADNPQAVVQTTQGNFVIELYAEKSPRSVANFVRYARDGFYEGTLFHRVIANYMIQGGGYTETFQKKQTYDPVPNESDNGLKNGRGTVAMARLGNPHSATSQFFINTNDNNALNFKEKSRKGWGYAVFGKVIEGMDTVENIQSVETGENGPFNKYAPLQAVLIEKVTIEGELPENLVTLMEETGGETIIESSPEESGKGKVSDGEGAAGEGEVIEGEGTAGEVEVIEDEGATGEGEIIEGDEVVGEGEIIEGDEVVVGEGEIIEGDEVVVGEGEIIEGDEVIVGEEEIIDEKVADEEEKPKKPAKPKKPPKKPKKETAKKDIAKKPVTKANNYAPEPPDEPAVE